MHFMDLVARFVALLCVLGSAWGQPADTSSQRVFPDGVNCPRPRYPQDAIRANATGTTRLRIIVETDGKIANVSIEHPSGSTYAHGLLDQAAVSTVWNCKFPAPLVGKRVLATQEFRWMVEEAPTDPPDQFE